MKTLKTTRFILKGLLQILLVFFEAFMWLGLIVWGLLIRSYDALQACSSVSRGRLRCPRGHEVPLSQGTYECETCGFVYQGSILECGNPECRATTPFVNCPECGLSVRNPYRWGRP